MGRGERLTGRPWGALLLELGVVVLGILIALQVDTWVQERGDRELESDYLERLVDDLSLEKTRMRAAAAYTRDRIEAGMRLDSVARGIGPTPSRAALASAVETVTWRSFPVIDAFVYRELQSTGRLSLIRSEPLRRMLTEHYTTLDDDARVGGDLTAHHRFEAAVAGLLNVEEQRAVEMGDGVAVDLAEDPTRAGRIASGFRAMPAATRELGNLVQHHTFNLKVIDRMLVRADEIIGYIRVLQGVRAASS